MSSHAISHKLTFGTKTITIGQEEAEGPITVAFYGFMFDDIDPKEGAVTISLDVEEADCVADVLNDLIGNNI